MKFALKWKHIHSDIKPPNNTKFPCDLILLTRYSLTYFKAEICSFYFAIFINIYKILENVSISFTLEYVLQF